MSAARALRGRGLGEIAEEMQIPLPANPKHAKGWVGELLEMYLGATAGNRPVPDFETLGIELKTLPLNAQLEPKESTFVCHAPLIGIEAQTWENSPVFLKLRHVLWAPVEADTAIDLSLRRVGELFLWTPTTQDWEILQRDWEEHMETIALGQLDQIDGRRGKYLQLRPKAFSGADRTKAYDSLGNPSSSNPRGFYLRRSVTAKILSSARK